VLEHLQHPIFFFQEAQRVLIPNGTMLIRVPYGGHHAAWWDITHLRPWFAENFAFVQPGYNRSTGNPQHDNHGLSFGVHIVQMRVSMKLAAMLRWWWWRWLFSRHSWIFDKEVEELWAHLFALKTDEARQHYMKDRDSNVVGAEFVAWKHHLTGEQRGEGEQVCMVSLGSGCVVNGFIASVKK
jgi:hypothetical protein